MTLKPIALSVLMSGSVLFAFVEPPLSTAPVVVIDRPSYAKAPDGRQQTQPPPGQQPKEIVVSMDNASIQPKVGIQPIRRARGRRRTGRCGSNGGRGPVGRPRFREGVLPDRRESGRRYARRPRRSRPFPSIAGAISAPTSSSTAHLSRGAAGEFDGRASHRHGARDDGRAARLQLGLRELHRCAIRAGAPIRSPTTSTRRSATSRVSRGRRSRSSPIATTSAAPGRQVKEIYVMDYDGANQRPFTAHRSLSIQPFWAADGVAMAYVSYFGGNSDIYLTRTDGRAPTRPANGNMDVRNYSPAISPDGTEMLFASSRDVNTGRTTSSSSTSTAPGLKNLTPNTPRRARARRPGARRATRSSFTSDKTGTNQLYLMSPEGLNVRRLPMDKHCDKPTWSLLNFIAFAYGPQNGPHDIALYDTQTQKVSILTDGQGSNNSPAVSTNGRHVVFTTIALRQQPAGGRRAGAAARQSSSRRLAATRIRTGHGHPSDRHRCTNEETLMSRIPTRYAIVALLVFAAPPAARSHRVAAGAAADAAGRSLARSPRSPRRRRRRRATSRSRDLAGSGRDVERRGSLRRQGGRRHQQGLPAQAGVLPVRQRPTRRCRPSDADRGRRGAEEVRELGHHHRRPL